MSRRVHQNYIAKSSKISNCGQCWTRAAMAHQIGPIWILQSYYTQERELARRAN